MRHFLGGCGLGLWLGTFLVYHENPRRRGAQILVFAFFLGLATWGLWP